MTPPDSRQVRPHKNNAAKEGREAGAINRKLALVNETTARLGWQGYLVKSFSVALVTLAGDAGVALAIPLVAFWIYDGLIFHAALGFATGDDTQPAVKKRPVRPFNFVPRLAAGVRAAVCAVTEEQLPRLVRDHILAAEGGFVDHPSDPGGATNYGIAQKYHPTIDIKNLTEDEAAAIYYRQYWKRNRCDLMPLAVGLAVFDSAVQHGGDKAVRMLQSIVFAEEDGIVGPLTLTKINKYTTSFICEKIISKRRDLYRASKNHHVFGAGWSNRLDKLQRVLDSIKI